MGINTKEAHWNGKPDWLDELVELFMEHQEHHHTPNIISGHDSVGAEKYLEPGAVGIENQEGGQGIIIRKLLRNGFVIKEIQDSQFYVCKMKDTSFSKQVSEGEASDV